MDVAQVGGALVVLAPVLVALGLAAWLWPVREAQAARVAKWAAGLLMAAQMVVIAAILLLVAALLKSNFSLEYVVRETALDLPTPYKLAALWAGQEGTVLLWACFVLSAALFLNESRHPARPPQPTLRIAIGLLAAAALGLLVLLIIKSPFVPVEGLAPEDGHGLNPLLQNPWMMIHPPVLFIGYTLLLVPAALAVASLIKGNGDQWVELGRHYALLGWIFLGAGMMLGGYWAYITLGWGGFWAWDPVENASLVPWLAATALLHGLSLQRKAGASQRLNYVYALLTGVAVIYGSYLTRSGVLSGFSVHSFEKVGAAYNSAWLTLLIAPLALGLVVMGVKKEAFAQRPLPATLSSMLQGAWVLGLMAALVCLGMSMPLLSQIGGGKGSAVGQGFYNQTQSVLFAAAALLLLLHLRPATAAPWVLGVIGGAISATTLARLVSSEYAMGKRVGMVLVAMVAGLMAGIALDRMRGFLAQRAWRSAGGALAHLGAALLVIGALCSGPGERSQRVELSRGQTEATPWGPVTLGDIQKTPDDKTRLILGFRKQHGEALMYESEQGQMRNPVLFHKWWGDIYLEPEEMGDPDVLSIAKGETKDFRNLKVSFTGFERPGSHGQDADEMRVGANVTIDDGSGPQPCTPFLLVTKSGIKPAPVTCGKYSVLLQSMEVESHTVNLRILGEDRAPGSGMGQRVVLRVTRKPAIGLVWLGTLLLLAGGALALSRPRLEMRPA
jgi:cytochrome c-type biogenesis protein CcmF